MLPILVLTACGGTAPTDPEVIPAARHLNPAEMILDPGEVSQFLAPEGATAVRWETTGGSIDPDGWYRAPSEPGTYVIRALDDNGTPDTAVVTVRHTDEPNFRDDFERCTLDRAANSEGFSWAETRGGSGQRPEVTSLIARSGRCSLRFSYRGGGADAWSEQRFSFGRKLTEVYLSWYQYYPDGREGRGIGPAFQQRDDPNGPDNNKLLRLWDEDYSDYNVKAGFSLLPSRTGNSNLNTEYMHRGYGGSRQTRANVGPWKPVISAATRGRWVRFQVHLKLASSAGANDGLLQLWLDGALLADFRGLPLYSVRTGARNYIRHGYIMGWANSGFKQPSSTYIDDVEISSRPIP